MSAAHRPGFLYHASALALSGHLQRPVQHLIEVQAGSTLPTTGGHGSAHVQNFRFDQTVSFQSGYSQVSGSEKIEYVKTDKGHDKKIVYTTLSTAVVEGLNILDVVTADRIVARLSSSFDPADENQEARILTIGSRFENLRIAGCKIEVELHHELAYKLDTFQAAIIEYQNNADFKKMVDDPFAEGKSLKRTKVEAHEVIHCSLVKKFDPAKCPGICEHHGHVLVVPEFGRIYLAEVLFQYGRKTITMLRVELGSPSSGNVAAGQADSNGRPPGGGG